MSDHWLVRPSTVRVLWIVFVAVLAVVVVLDLAVEHHAVFGLEATFGFGAWYGFASCIALIAIAKALGAVLKRTDTYYDR